MKVLKVKEVIQLIESEGWYLVRQKGSHRQYRHSNKSGTVTIPGNMNDELPPGTINSVFKQADLKNEK
ncbi:MAG TPA: type II toxin-antitoxin system HicA family toxin [Bacteroidales bacterium]|nr:type II toxin-antitoxin system HicA family toxin [Bacteroidales bacterium]